MWRSAATFIALIVASRGASAQDGSSLSQGMPIAPTVSGPYTRYASPGECGNAPLWSEPLYWRDKRSDTVYHSPDGNKNQPSTVQAVAGCAEKFSTGTAQERDLLGLGQAYLASEQDAKADEALNRLISLAGSRGTSAKTWAMYEAANVYLGAPQPKLAKAEAVIAQLDAMGAAAAVERMLAHTDFANAAQNRDSVQLQEREVNAALKASKEITGDTRKEYAPASAAVYGAMAMLKARQNDPKGALAAITTGRNELVPLRPSVGRYFNAIMAWYTPLGKKAPPLVASQWFNTGAGGDKRPIAGKPTLLVWAAPSFGGMAYPGWAILRRLNAKHQNVDITILSKTAGYYRNRLVKPDSEIILSSDYFVNYLKVPGAVGIWKTPLGKRNDGQVTIESAPNDEAYHPPGPPMDGPLVVFLIDSKGTIRLVSYLKFANEAEIDNVLKTLD